DAVAEPLGRAIGQVHAEQPQIARGPLEKVLIVALEEIPAATEVLPLGRPDLEDVFAIGDRWLSRELDYAAIRQFETVVGIEGGIVTERLHEVPRPDVPPTAQRRVAVEVQLLVLQVAAVDEVLILPDAVHHNVADEPLQQRPGPPIGRVARIDVRVHDPRPADEPTRVPKVVPDAGKQAAQAPRAILHRELAQPQRRGRGHSSDPRAAARELQVESVDLLEDQPAVDLRDAVVVAALDPIGIRKADARASAEALLGPQDRENGIVRARRRRERLIDRGEETDVGAEGRPGELDRRDRLDDATRIDQALRHLKQLAPLQKERPLLRKEQRLPRIERELARVRFDLRKVRFDRAVEGEVVRDPPADVAAHLGVSQVVLIAAGGESTARFPRRFRIQVHHEAAMHTAQADQVARLPDERRARAARRKPGILEAGVLHLAQEVQPPVLWLP